MLAELYRRRLDAAREDPTRWDGPIPQGSARAFEALDDAFTAADVVAVIGPSAYGLDVAAGRLVDWVAGGMAAEPSLTRSVPQDG